MSARNKLLEACISELAAGGPASVKSIAARAGVNHGLVHHYFGSKEALLVEALRWHDAALGGEVGALVSQEDYRKFSIERLLCDEKGLRLWVALLSLAGELPALRREMEQRLAQRAGVLSEILQLEGVRDAKLLMAAALGAELLSTVDRDVEPRAVVSALVGTDSR